MKLDSSNTCWGIDLGGTKIEIVVINLSKEVIRRSRISTEAEKGYDYVLDRIKFLIDTVIADLNFAPSKIGIGTPGSIEPSTQKLKNSNSVVLNDKTFKSDLEKK